MSKPLISPTVGRVVWFYPSLLTGESGFAPPSGDMPLAAIVAHVWSDTMVNLAVFDANGKAHSRTSVQLIHEELTADRLSDAFCTWMPFQRGQAKAQDAVAATASEKANAPRVSLARIHSLVKSETFTLLPNGRTTVCQLTLENGFTVEGQSACVSIKAYDKEVGQQIARDNAIEAIWLLEGYLLAQRLHDASTAHA